MVDEQALGEQATGLIRSIVSLDAVLLATAVVGGPRLRVVGSSALESAELWAWLRDAALRGTGQILDPAAGANVVLVDDALELRQGLAGLRVDTAGRVRVVQVLWAAGGPPRRLVVDRAELRDRLHAALRLTARVLDRVDLAGQLAQVAAAAGVLGMGMAGRWTGLGRPSGQLGGAAGLIQAVVTPAPAVLARSTLSNWQLAEELSGLLVAELPGDATVLP
jgi:hypothetical protein